MALNNIVLCHHTNDPLSSRQISHPPCPSRSRALSLQTWTAALMLNHHACLICLIILLIDSEPKVCLAPQGINKGLFLCRVNTKHRDWHSRVRSLRPITTSENDYLELRWANSWKCERIPKRMSFRDSPWYTITESSNKSFSSWRSVVMLACSIQPFKKDGS